MSSLVSKELSPVHCPLIDEEVCITVTKDVRRAGQGKPIEVNIPNACRSVDGKIRHNPPVRQCAFFGRDGCVCVKR